MLLLYMVWSSRTRFFFKWVQSLFIFFGHRVFKSSSTIYWKDYILSPLNCLCLHFYQKFIHVTVYFCTILELSVSCHQCNSVLNTDVLWVPHFIFFFKITWLLQVLINFQISLSTLLPPKKKKTKKPHARILVGICWFYSSNENWNFNNVKISSPWTRFLSPFI